MIEHDIQTEETVVLKTKAEKCIDVLNNFKEDLFQTIKVNNCLDEQMECLKKMNIFQEGSELLKEIFKIEK